MPVMPFNARHLLWLNEHRYVGALPMELGPFPFPPPVNTKSYNDALRDELRDWGLLAARTEATAGWIEGDTTEVFHPEAHKLLMDLAGNFECWKLGGSTLLHCLKTNDREEFEEEFAEVDLWGLRHAVRDIPRVPFVIAVTGTEILTAVSRPDELVIGRREMTHPPAVEAGRALLDMLDPKRNWTPWKGPQIMLPMSVSTELASSAETGAVVALPDPAADDDDDAADAAAQEREARVAEQKTAIRTALMTGVGAGFNESTKLAELATKPLSSMTEAVITYPSANGMRLLEGLSIGVSFIEGEGVMVSYPIGTTEHTRTVVYAPGTEENVVEAVKNMLELVVDDAAELDYLTGASWT